MTYYPDALEGGDDGDLGEPGAAITYGKLLPKICFARFGLSMQATNGEFAKDLYKHLRSMDRRPITRQTIRHWMLGKAIPARNNALIFLNSYLLENPIISSDKRDNQSATKRVSDARRKVYVQVLSFLRRSIVESAGSAADRELIGSLSKRHNGGVYMQTSSRVTIDTGPTAVDFLRISELVSGYYDVYRTRFTYRGGNYIARELIQIFVRGRGLRFKQWYRHEGVEISSFEGVAAVIGDSLWLIGMSRRDTDRMRVLKFRYIKSSDTTYGHIRWGIMLTDLPNSSSPDPVACRVLMIKAERRIVENESGKSEAFASDDITKVVANLREGDLDASLKRIILRTINNEVSAISMPQSIDPAIDGNGRPIIETDLRVNQQTLDNFRQLSSVGDIPAIVPAHGEG